jgi:cytochrome c-type biogenesis protein CcmH
VNAGRAPMLMLGMVLLAFAAAPERADAQEAVSDTAIQSPPPETDSVLEARTSALASQLRCPVCQGESIQDSPSALAQEMRALVRDQLAAGRTPDEVKAYFVARYGEWILLEPRARGINLVVYLAPFLVIVGGGLLIAFAVRRWIRTPVSGSSGTEPAARIDG